MHRDNPPSLTPIAQTGPRFRTFAPYVPALGADGTVAFQAELTQARPGARSSVFAAAPGSATGAGPTVTECIAGGDLEVVSHPAVAGGRCCFYAQTPRAERVVVLTTATEHRIIAEGAGPLGPTMNRAGVCAFRLRTPLGEAICRAGPDAAGHEQLAAVGQELDGPDGPVRVRAFQGLPVINESGCVSCCADLDPAGRAIVLWRPTGPSIVAHTGARFTWLGPFPMLDDAGRVVFAATEQAADGHARSGIYLAHRGSIECLVSSPRDGPFESFRGSLIDGHGRVVYFATPRGGTLGIYAGPDPTTDRILGIGDEFLGSTITEFALNPVSINRAGDIAVRLGLEDGRGVIVRSQPAARRAALQ
ncbi:MAG: hypothetical protein IT431_05810 [Phycisphaerales bacterium]|nr:hypothetical protein [Phycisphaerales bacterium]